MCNFRFLLLSANLSTKKKCKHIVMKIYSFFRLLNHKIKQYEKAASNPFRERKLPVTIIWVETPSDSHTKD